MRNGDDFSPAVIDRLAGILNEFRHGASLTLSQLATRVDLPRSSVHRLLAQLVDCGWVTRQGRSYSLSRSMLVWGARALQQDRLYRASHALLHELHRTTGLRAHLSVLNGPDVRHLDCVGPDPTATSGRIGAHQPALRTAPGIAMAAHASSTHPPATQVLEQIARHPRQAELRKQLALARQRRLASSPDPHNADLAWVSAPIGNQHTCIGALSLSGPKEQIDEVALGLPLRTAAREVWNSATADRHAMSQLTDVG